MTPLRVAARGLNLRRGAGTSDPVIKTLGQRVLVVPGVRSGDGRWTQVAVPEMRLSGWVANRYLEPLPRWQPGDPLWLALMYARDGEREIPGSGNNPWIADALACTTHPSRADATAHCSACGCWAMERSGIRSPRSAAAMDWMEWGVALREPRRGCAVILSRPTRDNPRSAHVGFWEQETRTRVYLQGANQGDMVCSAPFARSRIQGYRWPAGL